MSKERISKEYIELNNQTFKIEMYYEIGRTDYRGKSKERGYYVSVSPITLEEDDGYIIERYIGYTGIYQLLLPVKRKSKASETKAENILEERKTSLIEYVINKNGLAA